MDWNAAIEDNNNKSLISLDKYHSEKDQGQHRKINDYVEEEKIKLINLNSRKFVSYLFFFFSSTAN